MGACSGNANLLLVDADVLEPVNFVRVRGVERHNSSIVHTVVSKSKFSKTRWLILP